MTPSAQNPISPGNSYDLTDEDLKTLTDQAEAGDQNSSRRIYLYYNFSMRDQEKAISWLEKSAIHGSPDSQYGLAYEFARIDSSNYNLKKAKYWALKAIIAILRARFLLDEIEEREYKEK